MSRRPGHQLAPRRRREPHPRLSRCETSTCAPSSCTRPMSRRRTAESSQEPEAARRSHRPAGAREALVRGVRSATGLGERSGRPAVFLFVPTPRLDGAGGRPGGWRDRPRGSRFAALLRSHDAGASGSSVDVSTARASSSRARSVAPGLGERPPPVALQPHPHRRVDARTCHTCHEGSEGRTTDLMAFASSKSLAGACGCAKPESVALAETKRLRTTLLALGPVLLGLGLLFAYGARRACSGRLASSRAPPSASRPATWSRRFPISAPTKSAASAVSRTHARADQVLHERD